MKTILLTVLIAAVPFALVAILAFFRVKALGRVYRRCTRCGTVINEWGEPVYRQPGEELNVLRDRGHLCNSCLAMARWEARRKIQTEVKSLYGNEPHTH